MRIKGINAEIKFHLKKEKNKEGRVGNPTVRECRWQWESARVLEKVRF